MKFGPFKIDIGLHRKATKGPKPEVVRPTMGRIVREEFHSATTKAFGGGAVGKFVANRVFGKQRSSFDTTVSANGTKQPMTLRATSLDGALKEHSKILVAVMDSISMNAQKGFANIEHGVDGARDRIVQSLDKLYNVLQQKDTEGSETKAQPQAEATPSRKKAGNGGGFPWPKFPRKPKIRPKLTRKGRKPKGRLSPKALKKAKLLKHLKGLGKGLIAGIIADIVAGRITDTETVKNNSAEVNSKVPLLKKLDDFVAHNPLLGWIIPVGDGMSAEETELRAGKQSDIPHLSGGTELNDLKYNFSKDIKFKAQKIIFKYSTTKTDLLSNDSKTRAVPKTTPAPNTGLSMSSATADQRYDDNVAKYGIDKANALRDVENRPTSLGGIMSRLSPSNWGHKDSSGGNGSDASGGHKGGVLPSDDEMKDKDKKWMGGKDKGGDDSKGDNDEPAAPPGTGAGKGGPIPEATSKKTGDYLEGTERLLHAEGNMKGLDPKLLDTMRVASKDLPAGFHAEIISGHDVRKTGTTNHPNGIASDIKIYDGSGKLVPYDRGGPGMKYYEQFHQSMVERGKVMYPGEKWLWGGTWISDAAGHGDPMHMQRLDRSVPRSSQSSGAYDDNKGAHGHLFEPYLMNDVERKNYKQSIRDKIKSEAAAEATGGKTNAPVAPTAETNPKLTAPAAFKADAVPPAIPKVTPPLVDMNVNKIKPVDPALSAGGGVGKGGDGQSGIGGDDSNGNAGPKRISITGGDQQKPADADLSPKPPTTDPDQDLTPPTVTPQVDTPANNFRKYEGNNSNPDSGGRQRSDNLDDDKAVDRRSFAAYTGNDASETA